MSRHPALDRVTRHGPARPAAALGQWADGRSTDRQQLVDRLTPLQDAVAETVFARESRF